MYTFFSESRQRQSFLGRLGQVGYHSMGFIEPDAGVSGVLVPLTDIRDLSQISSAVQSDHACCNSAIKIDRCTQTS